MCADRGRRTLLVQKNVQAVLVAVLLELRVGDELGHEERLEGGRWKEERTRPLGRDDWRDWQQMGVGLYEQRVFPRGKQDYATDGAGTDAIQG